MQHPPEDEGSTRSFRRLNRHELIIICVIAAGLLVGGLISYRATLKRNAGLPLEDQRRGSRGGNVVAPGPSVMPRNLPGCFNMFDECVTSLKLENSKGGPCAEIQPLLEEIRAIKDWVGRSEAGGTGSAGGAFPGQIGELSELNALKNRIDGLYKMAMPVLVECGGSR